MPLSTAASSPESDVDVGFMAVLRTLEYLFAPHPVDIEPARDWRPAMAPIPADAIGVGFEVEEPLAARLAVVANGEDYRRLAATLMERPGTVDHHDARAAFTEFANIIASCFLSAVARRGDLRLVPSIPLVADELQRVIGALVSGADQAAAVQFVVLLPEARTSGTLVVSGDARLFESR